MTRVLMSAVLAIALAQLPAGTAVAGAQSPATGTVVASAESDVYDSDGTERYLQVHASRSGDATTVAVNGFTSGPLICADGTTVLGFTLITGFGPGVLDVSGPLDHATASARLDLTVQISAACPETPIGTEVLVDRPVGLTLGSISRPLRVLTSARVRIPAQQNDIHLQHQTVRSAAGDLTVDGATNPTTAASIERERVVAHDDSTAAATTSFLADLAQIDRGGSVIRQARGGTEERTADVPAPGAVIGRYVDVIAETVDRATPTLYALAVTDTVIACDDGDLGVLSRQRAGTASGSLEVGPNYTTAVAAAVVPLTEFVLDGCTGDVQQLELGEQPVSLDLVGTGPVLTASDFRVFVAAPESRGHERVVVTGRASVTGTVRVAEDAATPNFGGIGQRTEITHRVMTGE